MHLHPARRTFVPAMGNDRLLPLYDMVQRLAGVPGMHRALIDAADLHAGLRVLDIGCGTGNLVLAVRRRYPDVEVVGLDPDAKALDRARRKADRAGLALRLDQGYAEELPYSDGAFDRVLSSLMFHHLGRAAKAAMLTEVRRVLSPDGLLVLADFGGPVGGHGMLARRIARTERMRDNLNGIPRLMTAAGLREPAEIGRPRTRFGQVGLFRAAGRHDTSEAP